MGVLVGASGGVLAGAPGAPGSPLGAVAPPPDLWPGMLAMTWTGTDGSVWDLLRGTGGVVLLPDTRGLTFPHIDHYRSTAPSVPGSRWLGMRPGDREVFWRLGVVTGISSNAWYELDSSWWRSLHPASEGTWSVTTVRGTRTLRCRFVSDGDHSFPFDPGRFGWAEYGCYLDGAALWEGAPVVSQWTPVTGRAFLPGPPFWVGSGRSLAAATIPNPGDVPAHLVWKLTGPITSATVGTADKTIAVPFEVPAGATLTIDTRSDRMTAITGAGVDRTHELGLASFAPIPPGANVPVTVTMTGTGTVEATIIPLFLRAW